MLTELRVRNLGVISDLTLSFGAGMTALTGETGAGKTLLVHALQLVLGGRAEAQMVRAGADEAVVDARFTVDGTELFLSRSVPATGRSRAWVDGRMVPVSALAEAGQALVDIHGQHDHQSLLSTAAQRAALDGFAGIDLGPLEQARARIAEITHRIKELGGNERDRAQRVDLLRFQVKEIVEADLSDPDEDANLEELEEKLADVWGLKEAAAAAVGHLDPDDPTGTVLGALGSIAAARAVLSARPPYVASASRLVEAAEIVNEVLSDVRDVADSLEEDPGRLEEVQTRRRLIKELCRKYGDSIASVIEFQHRCEDELDRLARQEELAATAEADLTEATAALDAAASAVKELRAAAAAPFAAGVERHLRTLAMPEASFHVSIGDSPAGEDVIFLLEANRGEPAQPLARIASGGELARTMLAVRLLVEGGAPTMLFDEVDAGVGGTAALALARALKEVAGRRQVLVVTHLPQVAAAADTQISVIKAEDGGRTVTSAEVVEGDARVRELARMLSGHPDSDTAKKHAKELLAGTKPAAKPKRKAS